jgi:hypothetical protein
VNITTDDLLLLLGQKEAELLLLRRQIARLQVVYTDLKASLTAPEMEASPAIPSAMG